MKTPFQIKIEDRVADVPSLWAEPGMEAETVRIAYREAVPVEVKKFEGKDARELRVLLDFVKTEQFLDCVGSLRPGASIGAVLEFTKNSDGDDPPDFTLAVPGHCGIGMELTDCSPISACIAKISSRIEGGAPIPGVSDAETYRDVESFMRSPVSQVKPHFTDLGREGEKMNEYLERQMRQKDVPGNDVLLLASWLGGWPESEFAARAKATVKPKNIRMIALVSQAQSEFI